MYAPFPGFEGRACVVSTREDRVRITNPAYNALRCKSWGRERWPVVRLVRPSVCTLNGLSSGALVIPWPVWQLNVPQIGPPLRRRRRLDRHPYSACWGFRNAERGYRVSTMSPRFRFHRNDVATLAWKSCHLFSSHQWGTIHHRHLVI